MPLKRKCNVLQFVLLSVSLRNLRRALSPGRDTQRRRSLVSGEIFSEKFQIQKMFLFSSAMIACFYKVKIKNIEEKY